MFVGHLPELIIGLTVALVVFGPRRLPEIGSSLGKGLREFRTATSGIHDLIAAPASDLAAEQVGDTGAAPVPASQQPVRELQ